MSSVNFAVRVSPKDSLAYAHFKQLFSDPYEARDFGLAHRKKQDDTVTVVVVFPEDTHGES